MKEKEKADQTLIILVSKSMKEKLQKKANESGIGQMSAYIRKLIADDCA